MNQLKGSVIFKALAVLASFLVVPLMINYLGKERFGIWSTLLTVMSWIILFDLGIGNGLRNKVAEALAENQRQTAREYIGAGYSLVGLIGLVILIFFQLVSYSIPWQQFFNTTSVSEMELRMTVQIAGTFIIFNFWIGLIAPLLGAIQKSGALAAGQLISNGAVLGAVYSIQESTNATLTTLAVIYGTALVISNAALTIWFFVRNPLLLPKLNISRKNATPIFDLGLQFFIIQLAFLIIFMTDKVLITQLLGPEKVTEYEVVFKLFSIITFIHGLISIPLWSAYTESFKKHDFTWINKMLKNQLQILLLIVGALILLATFAKEIIALWIDTPLEIPTILVCTMVLMIVITTWNNVFATFINGTGLVKPQLYTSIAAMALNIPLSIYFVKVLEMDTSGVVMGTTISLLGAAVVLPFQTFRLLRKSNLQVQP
ncbi:MAG: oligosaccharide flippase family protein [Pseudomonadota bacterium]